MPRRLAVLAFCALLAGNAVSEPLREAQERISLVRMVATYMESCTRTDRALRDSCDRVGEHLSSANWSQCDLPAASFERRTAGKYADFRERYQAEYASEKANLDADVLEARRSFDRQFAQVLAGKVSRADLDSLARHLNGECSVIESEWLAPAGARR